VSCLRWAVFLKRWLDPLCVFVRISCHFERDS
jgi:hypothetical protein